MIKIAKKGDWVRIEQIILTPKQRLETLPESTKKVPLKCWINGFLQNAESTIGENVTILTNANRNIDGKLYKIWPEYEHNFGRPQPTLMKIGQELNELMKEGLK